MVDRAIPAATLTGIAYHSQPFNPHNIGKMDFLNAFLVNSYSPSIYQYRYSLVKEMLAKALGVTLGGITRSPPY